MTRYQPKINVFNRQRKFQVDLAGLESFSWRLARRLEVASGFTVMLVSDRSMRRYNRRFAGKSGTTDVLSFPDQSEPWESEESPYAGDILISVERAERQRKRDLGTELKLLSLHGLLHLLGFDHESDDGRMRSLEARLRKEFGLL